MFGGDDVVRPPKSDHKEFQSFHVVNLDSVRQGVKWNSFYAPKFNLAHVVILDEVLATASVVWTVNREPRPRRGVGLFEHVERIRVVVPEDEYRQRQCSK